jgi:hypothetical protein
MYFMSIEDVRGRIRGALGELEKVPGGQVDDAWRDVSKDAWVFIKLFSETVFAAQKLMDGSLPDANTVTLQAHVTSQLVESELHGASEASGRQEAQDMRNQATAMTEHLNNLIVGGTALRSAIDQIVVAMHGTAEGVTTLLQHVESNKLDEGNTAEVQQSVKSHAERYDATL